MSVCLILCTIVCHAILTASLSRRVSEWVVSAHIIGYLVPYSGVEDVIKVSRRSKAHGAAPVAVVCSSWWVWCQVSKLVCLTVGEVEHFLSPFEGSKVTAQSISISFYQGLFAYNGWSVVLYFISPANRCTHTQSHTHMWHEFLCFFLAVNLVVYPSLPQIFSFWAVVPPSTPQPWERHQQSIAVVMIID